jgi:hypothetical protein
MKKPANLTRDQLQVVVEGVLDALYPNADPDAEWSADTLDDVAAVLVTAGLVPKNEERPMVYCDHCSGNVPLDDCESTPCGSIHLDCGAFEAHAQECEVCRQDFKKRGLIG